MDGMESPIMMDAKRPPSHTLYTSRGSCSIINKPSASMGILTSDNGAKEDPYVIRLVSRAHR